MTTLQTEALFFVLDEQGRALGTLWPLVDAPASALVNASRSAAEVTRYAESDTAGFAAASFLHFATMPASRDAMSEPAASGTATKTGLPPSDKRSLHWEKLQGGLGHYYAEAGALTQIATED